MPMMDGGRCLVWLVPGTARPGRRARLVHRLDDIDVALLACLHRGTSRREWPDLAEDEIERRLRRLAKATDCEDANEFARVWHAVADPFGRPALL
jgi:hypothetical protein